MQLLLVGKDTTRFTNAKAQSLLICTINASYSAYVGMLFTCQWGSLDWTPVPKAQKPACECRHDYFVYRSQASSLYLRHVAVFHEPSHSRHLLPLSQFAVHALAG